VVAGWWPDRLLNDDLDRAVTRHAGATTLVDPRGRVTYAELRRLADRCATCA
jgi:non-ribosomal peptide synthetase component E (peptide arylation enzyme)